MNDSDRRFVALLVAVIAVVALGGAIGLGGIVLWRLKSGDDLPPGVVSYLLALVAIGAGGGGLLVPSPLSKTSGAGDVQDVQVVNEPEQPVPVDPNAGGAIVLAVVIVAALLLLALIL